MCRIKFIIIYVFLLVLVCCKSRNNSEVNPAINSDSLVYNPTGFNLVLPLHFTKVKYEIPADNQLTTQGVELGRMLFYDKQLSVDNSISCASCHKQANAFSDPNALSKGVQSQLGKRNSMSIVNLVFQDSIFFWDGKAKNIEHQVLFPIEDALEMNSNINNVVAKLNTSTLYHSKFFSAFNTTIVSSELIFKAIAQFERTIISTNSKFDSYILNKVKLTDQEKRGFDLFRTHPSPLEQKRGGNCGDCHNSVNFIEKIAVFRNNGLDASFSDEGRKAVTNRTFDAGKFRIPSLRNIALTAPYMHDGRFGTLEDVLNHYNEHIAQSATLDPLIKAASNIPNGNSLALTKQEKEDIIAFLHTLTDSTLITNTAYSNPFVE